MTLISVIYLNVIKQNIWSAFADTVIF